MSPFFSIIIPTLNEEHYLPKLLNSLLNQSDKDFEIIIVDGYSKDKTKEVVDKFQKKLPITFFKYKGSNVAVQRNYGAKYSNGKYLIFLDADTGIYKSFIKNLKKSIDKQKGLVFIPQIIPDENTAQSQIAFRVSNFLIELSQSLNKPLSSGGNMILEKNFFRLIGGFNEKLYISEDHELIQKANFWGVRARYLKNIKVKFCLRRLKREGQLLVLYKYLLAIAHMLIKGDIKKKIFDYKMGGEDYQEKLIKIDFNKNFEKTKKFFSNQLKKI